MSFSLRTASWQDKSLMLRLLEFHQYDMGEFVPAHLNESGEYGFAVDG